MYIDSANNINLNATKTLNAPLYTKHRQKRVDSANNINLNYTKLVKFATTHQIQTKLEHFTTRQKQVNLVINSLSRTEYKQKKCVAS